MSIVFIAGTTAELIKVSPVMRELDARGVRYRLWSTAQHVTGVKESLADLDVRDPDEHLIAEHKQAHVSASRQVPGWVARLAAAFVGRRPELRAQLTENGGRGVVVVHGDTFSTVIGAVAGRLYGARVAHVEAGLRSGSFRSPFPEELNRRVVGHVATLHFAPTPREVDNLRAVHAPGEVVLTGANTVVDALRLAMTEDVVGVDLPPEFGLVTLHRFELLRQPAQFTAIIRSVARHAEAIPMVMVAGKAERKRLAELGLEGLFGDRLTLIDKRPYAQFLPILARASFVVTDSGGLQEECAALGIPCAVHRERTERHQGLGENVVLTRMEQSELDAFLDSWPTYRRASTVDELHPSAIIADALIAADKG